MRGLGLRLLASLPQEGKGKHRLHCRVGAAHGGERDETPKGDLKDYWSKPPMLV